MKMARTSRQSHLSSEELKSMRKELGRNQRDFWSMFGVSQPLGSRFEKDITPSVPVAMLVWLRSQQKLSDQDLTEALSALGLSAPQYAANDQLAA
jgi:predicted transcriptional regulator